MSKVSTKSGKQEWNRIHKDLGQIDCDERPGLILVKDPAATEIRQHLDQPVSQKAIHYQFCWTSIG